MIRCGVRRQHHCGLRRADHCCARPTPSSLPTCAAHAPLRPHAGALLACQAYANNAVRVAQTEEQLHRHAQLLRYHCSLANGTHDKVGVLCRQCGMVTAVRACEGRQKELLYSLADLLPLACLQSCRAVHVWWPVQHPNTPFFHCLPARLARCGHPQARLRLARAQAKAAQQAATIKQQRASMRTADAALAAAYDELRAAQAMRDALEGTLATLVSLRGQHSPGDAQ